MSPRAAYASPRTSGVKVFDASARVYSGMAGAGSPRASAAAAARTSSMPAAHDAPPRTATNSAVNTQRTIRAPCRSFPSLSYRRRRAAVRRDGRRRAQQRAHRRTALAAAHVDETDLAARRHGFTQGDARDRRLRVAAHAFGDDGDAEARADDAL